MYLLFSYFHSVARCFLAFYSKICWWHSNQRSMFRYLRLCLRNIWNWRKQRKKKNAAKIAHTHRWIDRYQVNIVNIILVCQFCLHFSLEAILALFSMWFTFWCHYHRFWYCSMFLHIIIDTIQWIIIINNQTTEVVKLASSTICCVHFFFLVRHVP